MRVVTHNVAVPLLTLLVAIGACHRQTDSSAAFVDALRCGMTRDEVSRLAHEKGYNPSDASWLTRSAATKKSEELTLVDLTFRQGKLVAVRQGRYDPRTNRVAYRTIDLCAR